MSEGPNSIDAELALWKQLVFGADMPAPDDDTNRPHFHAPQFPPETYMHLVHALLSLSHAYPPTLPSYNFPWPSNFAPPVPSSFYPTSPPMPLPPRAVPQSSGATQLIPSPAASTAQDPDVIEDATSVDDKRRRNTAASARFRVKRKLKTLSLERTVADLTGRAGELEREANDLRRENAWLKEIVLLKGRNVAAINLGSQAPAPPNRHDLDERDDRTHAGSELEPTVRRRGRGKDKES